MLQALAGLSVMGPAAAARAFPPTPALAGSGATILVAGPDGGELDVWAHLLGPVLTRYLAPGASVRVATSGASDGVTGANQFDARTAPDGGTLLMVPGAAPLAWLLGDPRARFDAGQWIPVLAMLGPAVVVGRPGALRVGAKPSVAVARPADVTALLALHLMEVEPRAVFGLVDTASVRDAFARGEVDFALVSGPDAAARLAAFTAAGARPVFSVTANITGTQPTRDPHFADVPSMGEAYAALRGGQPSGRLYQAWLALAVAARLAFGLILPQLAPASLVAQWRRAGSLAAAAPEIQAAAAKAGVQPVAGLDAASAAVAPDAASLLELRRWLASRYDWRPG